jgi:DNA-binding transcriptional LysR family regulator
MDSRYIDEIMALVAISNSHSFVGAARVLQRDPTVISKRLAALERRLGVRLLERTTRHVRLTDAGARLAERFRYATDLLVEAEEEAALSAAEIRGSLRIALPAAMGRVLVGPMLPEFLRTYPLISLEVDYSDRYVDMIAEGVDVAVRIGALTDSRLVAKKLSAHRRVLCASPDYINQNGAPESPEDLVSHNCLRFKGLASYPEWRLSRGDEQRTVLATGTLTTNDSEMLVAAALAGVGIIGTGEWQMNQLLADGKLVRVLPEWVLDAQVNLYLVRPSARFTPAKTKAFMDWLIEKFAPPPPPSA